MTHDRGSTKIISFSDPVFASLTWRSNMIFNPIECDVFAVP